MGGRGARIGIFLLALLALISLFSGGQPVDRLAPGWQPLPNSPLQRLTTTAINQAIRETKAKQGLLLVMDLQHNNIVGLAGAQQCNGPTGNCLIDAPELAGRAWEPGSVFKPLIMAAALDRGVIKATTSYYDPGHVTVDGRAIYNLSQGGSPFKNMQLILSQSLNTGAVYLLEQLGGGQLNARARTTWYSFLTQHYMFGKLTGGGLGPEETGYVRPPTGGEKLNFRYANSAFGVGVAVTPLQLMAAYGTLVNGGIYRPINQAKVTSIDRPVLKLSTSQTMQAMLQQVVAYKGFVLPPGFIAGGKSGTAPLPDDKGNYKINGESGSFIGFVGKQQPQYLVLLRLDEPATEPVASTASGKYWLAFINKMIDAHYVQ